jgi:phosphoribosylformylglycinamidine synthase
MGRVADVRRCVTMDLKGPDSLLCLIGVTKNEMGGSHYNLVNALGEGCPPRLDQEQAPAIFRCLHEAIERGLIRACHDLSEGGLAVAAAEMAFAGEIGADISLEALANQQLPDEVLLFSESTTRFLIELAPGDASEIEERFLGLPMCRIGKTMAESRLRISGQSGHCIVDSPLSELKEVWQKPLRW